MSTEPAADCKVEEGSLAFALILNFIDHQVGNGKLSRSDAEAILRNTCNGAGAPAAQQLARRQLKGVFPELDF